MRAGRGVFKAVFLITIFLSFFIGCENDTSSPDANLDPGVTIEVHSILSSDYLVPIRKLFNT